MEALRARIRAGVMQFLHAVTRRSVLGAAGLVIALLACGPARAQIGSERYSSIIIDAATGNVLSAASADEPRYPASLTKMMTLYMAFEALRDRRVGLDTPVPVSAHAASMSPSKLGLTPGMRLTLEQAILGLVTKSANDAAAAVGEMLGGDETRFAQMMTLRARALGMSHSTFRNASGLPDTAQTTTARDLAVLARHLVQDFPDEYHYFSTPSFVFHGRTILNHDHLLTSYPGADGIKTGYIEASGFNLVTSAVRGDVRLIGVVMGAARPGERDLHMAALLDQGFAQMNVPVGPRHDWGAHTGGGLVASAQAATLDAAAVTSASVHARPPGHGWSVQTGSFASDAAARAAASLARRGTEIGDLRVEPAGSRHRPLYRAVLAGLTQGEARSFCAALLRRHFACSVLPTGTGDLASR
jgi:D-alanyl-D-alanine carboxypeptidase